MRRVRHLKMSSEWTRPSSQASTNSSVAQLRSRLGSATAALLSAVAAVLMSPAAAAAHGPVDPAASSYLATIATVPSGIHAQVVDGDQRMWLRTRPGRTVVVLDYRGVPYLRFRGSGVDVNRDSAMYYLNQVPAQTPPPGLAARTPSSWQQVATGPEYEWHDGRLHALASTARRAGVTYLGRWTIPVLVDGSATTISGRLFYAGDPSIVWFWPILVVIACVLAVVRLRRAELDLRAARALALGALIAFMIGGAGQQLHGRPTVSAGQLIVLALVLAFGGWGLACLARRRHGWFQFFAVAVAAIWEGATLITVLLDGFVLIALPAFVARAAVAVCLASGAGLLVLVFRLAERPDRSSRTAEPADEDDLDWEDERPWERHA